MSDIVRMFGGKYDDSGLLMTARRPSYDKDENGRPIAIYGADGLLLGLGYRSHTVPLSFLAELGLTTYDTGELISPLSSNTKTIQDKHLILSVFSDWFTSYLNKKSTKGNLPRDFFAFGARYYANVSQNLNDYTGFEFVTKVRLPIMDCSSPMAIFVEMGMGRLFGNDDLMGTLSFGIEASVPIFSPSK